MLKNSKLYLVLDTDVGDYDRLFFVAREAFKNGIDIIQLRDKTGLAKDILTFADKLRDVLKGKIPFIINDRVDVAIAAKADGVHLGQDDLSLKFARRMMGRRAIIGASCQTLAQARAAQREGADYIGFGSAFKTLTKPERQPMDLKLLAQVASSLRIPVFAIGGIHAGNIHLIKGAGAKRIAVCRAICDAADAGAATFLLKKTLY